MSSNFYFKKKSPLHGEAWIEEFNSDKCDWEVVCDSKLTLQGDTCLIDEITTDPKASRGEGDMRIFVYLNEGEDNPVTGETGGGFYVGGLKDLISHYF